MPDAVTFHHDAKLCCVDVGGVAFVTWYEAPQMAQLVVLRGFTHELRARYPDGYVFLSVIFRGVPTFTNEVRNEAAAITRESQAWAFATAHVVLITGFVGAAVRSFLNTMMLLSRPKQPIKVLSDLEDGIDFVLEHVPTGHALSSAASPSAREVLLSALRDSLESAEA